MTPTLVFDLETIPDAQGLRRLNPEWDAGLSDTQVIEAALAARQESHGNDFLPLHLHKVAVIGCVFRDDQGRSEEHTSELQSLMRISYAVFCLKKKTHSINETKTTEQTNTIIHKL